MNASICQQFSLIKSLSTNIASICYTLELYVYRVTAIAYKYVNFLLSLNVSEEGVLNKEQNR